MLEYGCYKYVISFFTCEVEYLYIYLMKSGYFVTIN